MTLISRDAITRCEIVDAELGWESGTAIGKMAMLWNKAQEDEGLSVIRRRQVLEWARVRPEHGDLFIEVCCRADAGEDGDYVHFLEQRGADRFFIVGNPDQIANLARHREQKSNAGKASAGARAAKNGTAIPTGARNHPSKQGTEQKTEQPFGQITEQTSERQSEQTTERITEQTTEQTTEQPPNPSAFASALAGESADSPPTPPPEGGAAKGKQARESTADRPKSKRDAQRELKERAARIVARAVGVVRRQSAGELVDDDGPGAVGEDWKLVAEKYPRWRDFFNAYANASSRGNASSFESTLERQLRSLLAERAEAAH